MFPQWHPPSIRIACFLLAWPLRIPRDLPDMAVRILEVAGVSSPEGLRRGLGDDCTGAPRLRHDRVDFGSGRYVLRQRELGRARRSPLEAGVVRDARAGPERESHAALQVDEYDGAVLELLPHDSDGREA